MPPKDTYAIYKPLHPSFMNHIILAFIISLNNLQN